MKKYLGVLVAILFVVAPVTASAAQFSKGEDYTLAKGDRVTGDLYAAGQKITISGVVEGDALIASGQVIVDGTVQKDLAVIGGHVTISGTINDTARIAGGTVDVSGHIAGDLVIAGGKVHLMPGSSVGGDLIVAAGNLTNEGQVRGKLYVTDRHSHPMDQANFARAFVGFIVVGALLKLLMTIIAALLLVIFFHRTSRSIVEHSSHHFGRNILTGLVVLIVTPIIAVALCATVLGIPIGILLGLIFLGTAIVSGLLAPVLFGVWLWKLVMRSSNIEVNWKTALVGVVAFYIISWLPFIGGIFSLVLFLAVFGAASNDVYNRFWKNR